MRPLNGCIHQRYLEAKRAKDQDGRRLRDEITEKRSEIARLVRRLGEARMTEPPAEVLERIKALGAEVAQAEGRLQAKRPARPTVPSEAKVRGKLREYWPAPPGGSGPKIGPGAYPPALRGLYLDPDGGYCSKARTMGSSGLSWTLQTVVMPGTRHQFANPARTWLFG